MVQFPWIGLFAELVSLSPSSTFEPLSLSLSLEAPLLKISCVSSQLLSNSLIFKMGYYCFRAETHLIISGSSGALQMNLCAYPCWPLNSLQCTFGQWEARPSNADSYKALPSLKGTTRSSSACNIKMGTSITYVKNWKIMTGNFEW